MSWSHKLFFKVNAQVGKRKWLDNIMYFCAHWLIYVIVIVVFWWGAFSLVSEDPSLFVVFIKLLLTGLVLVEIISYGVALLWRHPRPYIEFPDIKHILNPVESWKSFPSDHTIFSFVFALVVIHVGAPVFFCVSLLILATLVACGRVYVGVHYPRDIVGGLLLAIIFGLGAPWLLTHVTQPLYNVIRLLLN
ncbi:MAG: phosphatase PAP2 family protein [Candidatus Magasanikbacteria bacterium]